MISTPTRIGVGEVRISEGAKANVADALSRDRLSYGRYSQEFERRWAELHGRRFAVFVNSGTSALQIGLAAMKEKYGWKDGAEVLVPAVTFVASVNVILQNNLTPVLVDVDNDFAIDEQQVMEIVGRREAAEYPMPAAVMPVHLFGKVAPTMPWLEKFGIRRIADSCETVGMLGCADGDVSAFSTYACHLIQTGVGGFATTDDPRLAELIRSLANHGRDGIYTGIDAELGKQEIIEARFRFERMGYSYRATELEAAIGCAELDDWLPNLRNRQHNARYLRGRLAGLPIVVPDWDAAWMMFPIRAQTREHKTALVTALERDGIETRDCLPLTNQPYLKSVLGPDVEDRFPVARRMNETSFYVGCHQWLTESDLDRIAQSIRSAC